MAHLAFLGVGPELATAMAVFVLLVAILVWPLAPKRFDRRLAAVMAVLVVASGGLALSVRLDPPAASAPIWLR
jgi:cation transport ATPase